MNLNLMLEEMAKQYGGKTAFALGEHRLSYAELDETSNKIANALIKMGVGKGDRVAILLPNIPEFPVIYFGIVKTGGIAVPLDIRYKVDELVSLCDNSEPKVIVTESPYLEPLIPALPQFKSIEHVIDMSSKYEGRFHSYREMKQFCRERLADFKVPKQIVFMASLPKTITGQIRKEVLKQMSMPYHAR